MGDLMDILYLSDTSRDTLLDISELEEADTAVVTAISDVSEGLRRLEASEFDCIFSESKLSDRTGVEFLSAVREHYPALPFILFESDSDDIAVDRATAAGVTDIVTCSSDSLQYELLLNRVQAFVSQYRRENERNQQDDLFARTHQITAVGVWEHQLDTSRSFVSDDALEIYGLSPGDNLPLEQTYQYYHPDDRDDVRDAFQQARDHGRSFDLKARVLRGDGTQRWVRTRGEAFRVNGEIQSVWGTIRDISERERIKSELNHENNKLNDLIRVVTHDIRNPLQVGFGQLEHARDTGSTEAFDRIQEALERIQELMDHIVTLSQQGQEPQKFERLDLVDVAHTALDAVDESRITLTAVDHCSVDGNPARLQRLFERLFENTAKHTNTNVTVTIGLIQPVLTSTREIDVPSAGFYIEDDGPGFDDDLTHDIFEGGYTTTANETGFRLANVAQIADAHGWDMNVSTSSGRGTRFEFVDRTLVEP